MIGIDDYIKEWYMDYPYPHTNDITIINKYENNKEILTELNKLWSHIWDSSALVREKYLSKILNRKSNDEILKVFEEIKEDLSNFYLSENNEISKESYLKLINVLIYNCFMH